MSAALMSRRRVLSAAALAVSAPGLGLWPSGTVAQTAAFPSKPLQWIVGYPAGSGMDVLARIVSEGMARDLGQQVVVMNRPGAAGSIAASSLASVPADGHTLLTVDMGIYAQNPHLYSKLSYDPRRDFAMVGMMVQMPPVLVVPTSLNVASVTEFVQYVKSRPEKSLNFASSGVGNPTHLNMEIFQRKAGLSMAHVPYRGSPAALADMATGQVIAMFVDANTPMPFVQSGKLRFLATATPRRVPLIPDVPTMAEAGYDMSVPIWVGVGVARATPQPVIDRLNRSLNDSLQNPQVQKRLADAGLTVAERTSARQADDYARAEFQQWGQVIAPMNIALD
jgi:tripartite-type tricarboxylate transporter receptor subunit TctC